MPFNSPLEIQENSPKLHNSHLENSFCLSTTAHAQFLAKNFPAPDNHSTTLRSVIPLPTAPVTNHCILQKMKRKIPVPDRFLLNHSKHQNLHPNKRNLVLEWCRVARPPMCVKRTTDRRPQVPQNLSLWLCATLTAIHHLHAK